MRVLKVWDLYCDFLPSKPIIRELHLGGGTPTFFSAKNLELLIYGILKRSGINSHSEFSFEAHPSSTTKEKLETLFNLGFKRLSLGVQDFNKEDQIIRKHILNLMCHFETEWYDTESQLMHFDDILEKLSELENDGLCYTEGNKLFVTQQGQKFVRNICMAFDLKLQRKQPDQQLFSSTI